MTLDEINSRLEELRRRKAGIQGLETEVYARIVGYYRSVRNWNKGKTEEYGIRRNYTGISSERTVAAPDSVPGLTLTLVKPPVKEGGSDGHDKSGAMDVRTDRTQTELGFDSGRESVDYLYFFRKTCPNCPPVASWLDGSGLVGRHVDVDRESGMLEAEGYFISTAPTVILLDEHGKETGRGSSVAALNSLAGAAAAAGA